MTTQWIYGGGGDLFRELSWTNRPDMSGSHAPKSLQDAWTATILAIRDVCGTLRKGTCFIVNLTAAPVIEKVLNEPVRPCAGYAGYVDAAGRFECGFRYRPEKWSKWIDADAGAHLPPWSDVHTWCETSSYLVDFDGGMGDPSDAWPPLIYRPKWQLPKHPRDARGAGSILLWRQPEALAAVQAHVGVIVPLITARAFEILAEHAEPVVSAGCAVERTVCSNTIP